MRITSEVVGLKRIARQGVAIPTDTAKTLRRLWCSKFPFCPQIFAKCGFLATVQNLEEDATTTLRLTDLRHIKPLFSRVHCFRRVVHVVRRIPILPVRTKSCTHSTKKTASIIVISANGTKWIRGDYEIGRSVRCCMWVSVHLSVCLCTRIGGDMHSERLLVIIIIRRPCSYNHRKQSLSFLAVMKPINWLHAM